VLCAQTIDVIPSRIMVDESATIRVSGLRPNERIEIQATLTDGAGEPWASHAGFVADQKGIVDLSTQAPVKGSYSEVSAMGLVWSMIPRDKQANYRFPGSTGAQIIEFRLLVNGQQVATTLLEQRMVADGVRRINVQGQLHGVLFVPAGSPRPGALVLGGSEGGVPLQKAAWLASHGFAALALAYFRYEDLPPNLEAIPLEYFGRALGWMMQRPEILPDQIAVMGTSRGGELTLQLASMYPQIRAVVAYVPANVRYPACCGNTAVPYAWTWKGQPLAYVSGRPGRSLEQSMTAMIAVEQAQASVLLIAGRDDGVWPSSMMAAAISDRLKKSHFAHPVEVLTYPHAGHRAGRPEIVPAWHGRTRHPVSGREVELGGTAKGDAQSSLDAIPKVLAFLRQALGSGSPGQETHKP
jgi:dienelactone hydrolase